MNRGVDQEESVAGTSDNSLVSGLAEDAKPEGNPTEDILCQIAQMRLAIMCSVAEGSRARVWRKPFWWWRTFWRRIRLARLFRWLDGNLSRHISVQSAKLLPEQVIELALAARFLRRRRGDVLVYVNGAGEGSREASLSLPSKALLLAIRGGWLAGLSSWNQAAFVFNQATYFWLQSGQANEDPERGATIFLLKAEYLEQRVFLGQSLRP